MMWEVVDDVGGEGEEEVVEEERGRWRLWRRWWMM